MLKMKLLEKKDNFYPIFLGCLEKPRSMRELCRIYESKTHCKLTTHLYQKKIYEDMIDQKYLKEAFAGKDARERRFISEINKIGLLLLNKKIARQSDIKNFLKLKECRKYFSIENLLTFFNNDYEALKRDGKMFILAVFFTYNFIDNSIKGILAVFNTMRDDNVEVIIKNIESSGIKIPTEILKKRLYDTFYITCREMKATLESIAFQSIFYQQNIDGLIDKILKDMNYHCTFKQIKKIIELISSQPLPPLYSQNTASE